jgi:hypothetical protein
MYSDLQNRRLITEAETVLREADQARARLGLFSKLKTAGTNLRAVSITAAGFTSFYIGWKIGSGINAKYLKFGVGRFPQAYDGANLGSAEFFLLWCPGTSCQAYSNHQTFGPGWYVGSKVDYHNTGSLSTTYNIIPTSWSPGAVGNGTGWPDCAVPFLTAATYLTGTNADIQCAQAHGRWGSLYVPGADPEDTLLPGNPTPGGKDFEATDNVTATTPAPADPNLQNDATAQTIAQDYPNLSDWYCFQFRPDLCDDPTKVTPAWQTIPAPASGEHYQAYIQRLQDLGLVGVATILSDAQLDPQLGPDAVVRTSPMVGTRVAPGTSVDVFANPHDAPAPEPDPGGSVGGADPTGWTAPPVPPINLEPLKQSIPCGSFPFGIFCWINDTLGGWVGGASCPTPELPSGITGHPIEVNMCIGEPALVILRPLILIVSAIGLAWLFASTAMGLGAAGKDD